MHLRPQDILILLDLALEGDGRRSLADLGQSVGVSASEVHGALKRARESGLLLDKRRVNRKGLLEFLVHGLKYVWPARRGPLTRGIPTGYAAPALREHFAASEGPPPVWPDPEGEVRGETFVPIYPSVPHASRTSPDLYNALALVDAIRGGRVREQKIAADQLRQLLAR